MCTAAVVIAALALVAVIFAPAVGAVDLARIHARTKSGALTARHQLFGARRSQSEVRARAVVEIVPHGSTWTDSMGVNWKTADGKFPFDYPAFVPEAVADRKVFGATMPPARLELKTMAPPPGDGKTVVRAHLAQAAPGKPVYVIEARRMTLFHSTIAPLVWDNTPPFHPLWLSPDVAQSLSGGLFKFGEVEATLIEHNKQNPPSQHKLLPSDIVLYEIEVNTPLHLFPLPPCASTAAALLINECRRLTDGKFDCFRYRAFPQWAAERNAKVYHVLMSLGTPDIADIRALCQVWATEGLYDGWRAPWDQDEVMVCPHAIPKLTIPGRPVQHPSEPSAKIATPGVFYRNNRMALPFHALKGDGGAVPVTDERITSLPTNHPHHTHPSGGFQCVGLDATAGKANEALRPYLNPGGGATIGTYQTTAAALGGSGPVWAVFPPATVGMARATALFGFNAELRAGATREDNKEIFVVNRDNFKQGFEPVRV